MRYERRCVYCGVYDRVSLTCCPLLLPTQDSFFDQERNHLKALDLRVTGLAAFLTPDGIGASVLQAKPATLSAECVRRSLEAAVAEERRCVRSSPLISSQRMFFS